MKRNLGPSILALLCCAALCALILLGATGCQSQAKARVNGQERAALCLSPDASLYLAWSPADSPELVRELGISLGPERAKALSGILKRCKVVYAAVDIGLADAPLGQTGLPRCALALYGGFPRAMVRSSLSRTKGLRREGGYFVSPEGLALSPVSNDCIILCTYDIGATLERYRRAAEAAADAASHPLAQAGVLGPTIGGIIAYSPKPSTLTDRYAAGMGIPGLKAAKARALESGLSLDFGLSLIFDSERESRLYYPVSSLGLKLIGQLPGIDGARLAISRDAQEVRADGYSAPCSVVATNLIKLAALPSPAPRP